MTTAELELWPKFRTNGLLEEVAFDAETSSSDLAVAVMPASRKSQSPVQLHFNQYDIFFWHINALSFLDCADILPWQVELTLLVDNSEENEASYATNTKIQWAKIHLWNDPLTFID